MAGIVICSKSPWRPAIRREHAVARSAAAEGREVVFVERPLDVRALRDRAARAGWRRAIRPRAVASGEAGITLVPRSSLVPPHRSTLAGAVETLALRRALRAVPGTAESLVVATVPWQWPAVARTRARRRVFDAADDWRTLLPARAAAIDRLYRRIAREADGIIVASPDLVSAFPGRQVTVVRNGADPALIGLPLAPVPCEPRMVYLGTLSERVDVPFLLAVLERLQGWTADLYGPCQYAGMGERPGAELAAALAAHPARLRWHGPVAREAAAAALDRGRVLIAPHRAAIARGQDSMKLYDYVARGRPIVCTPGALGSAEHIGGVGVIEAATPEEFALAVGTASGAPQAARGDWLQVNAWSTRWALWRAAAEGSEPR